MGPVGHYRIGRCHFATFKGVCHSPSITTRVSAIAGRVWSVRRADLMASDGSVRRIPDDDLPLPFFSRNCEGSPRANLFRLERNSSRKTFPSSPWYQQPGIGLLLPPSGHGGSCLTALGSVSGTRGTGGAGHSGLLFPTDSAGQRSIVGSRAG